MKTTNFDSPATTKNAPRLDPMLEAELKTIAERLRAERMHRRAANLWAVAAVTGWVLVLLQWQIGFPRGVPFAVMLGLVAAILARNSWLSRRTPVDLAGAAKLVDRQHPELKQALVTAVEQVPDDDGKFNFLQRLTISQALGHAREHRWLDRIPQSRTPAAMHVGAMIAVFLSLAGIWTLDRRTAPRPGLFASASVQVTPGNAEIERGSTVVVAARFEGPMPRGAELHWQAGRDETKRLAMARSLSDPIFATSLPSLSQDVVYWVEHDGKTSEKYRLTVFELPALVRADASLAYPAYTGLKDRLIEDTRRVSAVEGTKLVYTFNLNKAADKAILKDAGGGEIALVPGNPERTQFTATFAIETSRRFKLLLEDREGRKNAAPPDIRVEALPNRTPKLKLTFPRGDQRPSALEEIRLAGEAHDDFALVDYGIGYALRDGQAEYVSSKKGEARTADATFQHLLDLEARGVEPDDLLSWFAWADDHGPDGVVRRTTSDGFFAEVRPFDQEFREEAASVGGGAQQQNGAGGESGDLLELQREISIAIWKQKQQPPGKDFAKDVETIKTSQEQAQTKLAELKEQLNETRQKTAADAAERGMKQSADALSETVPLKATEQLNRAWSGSQAAYRALLRMQPRDTRVSQSREQRSARGGRNGQRNQGQLNQLDFKQSDSRYETETQAESLTTPEEREQLGILARLREMARRQQDLNERVRELQAALAAADDAKKKEELQRELKRLEEEQRRMLADLDETRGRLDRLPADEQSRQAQEQLDRTREQMRRSGEELGRGETSEALAAGSRAREQLDQARENFRKETSSQFSEQMREARQAARELTEKRRETEGKLGAMDKSAKSLDDTGPRDGLAQAMEQERRALDGLMNDLRQMSDAAEETEPQLHRKLYDLLRQQNSRETDQRLQVGAEMLRRGLVDQARELQPELTRNMEQLQKGVESAAESVLGDETTAMRFAQRELEDLARQLREEEKNGARGGEPATRAARGARDGNQEAEERLAQAGGKENDAAERDNTERGANSDRPGDRPSLTGGDEKSGGPGRQASAEKNNGKGQGPGESENSEGPPRADGRLAQGEQSAEAGRASRGADSREATEQSGGRAGDGQRGAQARSAGGESEGREELSRALESFSGGGGAENGGAPLSGERYGEWNERLRTVEELIEDPGMRQRLGVARQRAEELRRDFKRHSKLPQWGDIESSVLQPLNEARVFLRQELARRDQPESLQPADRDPVPDRFAESLKKYYEALGR